MGMTHDEPDIMNLDPRWPGWADVRSKNQYTVSYDAVSDTLYFDFYGPGKPAVNVEIDKGDHDYLFQRVDVDTQEVIGLQVDDFLAYAIHLDPYVFDVLDFAELHGITREQVAILKHKRSLPPDHQASAEEFFGELAKMTA